MQRGQECLLDPRHILSLCNQSKNASMSLLPNKLSKSLSPPYYRWWRTSPVGTDCWAIRQRNKFSLECTWTFHILYHNFSSAAIFDPAGLSSIQSSRLFFVLTSKQYIRGCLSAHSAMPKYPDISLCSKGFCMCVHWPLARTIPLEL
jgi:hypothetical protein